MDRLAAAMDLCRIFSIHLSWDQDHRQLNYSRMEHCDHLKPAAWKGDLVAHSCNPESAWSGARTRAEAILESYHVATDFTEIFSEPDVDMLRPFPGGVYPGICTDPDLSAMAVSETPADSHNPIEDEGDEAYENELEADIEVTIDDILNEPPAPPELEAQAGSDWIQHEGHKFHKSSLLRVIFCSYFVAKSKVRLERVRAYSTDFQMSSAEQSDDTLLGVSHLPKIEGAGGDGIEFRFLRVFNCHSQVADRF